MTSDAGGGKPRRRRDSNLLLCFFGSFWLVSSYIFSIQFSEPSRTFTSSTVFDAKSTAQGRGRRWFPANTPLLHPLHLQSPPKPFLCCDPLIKAVSFYIAQMPFHRSRYAQAPLEDSSHWVSLMARDFPLGPSDVPCLVESSMAHGGVFFWVVFPWLSDKRSTTKVVISLTHNFGSFRSASKFVQRLTPVYRTPATSNISDMAVLSRISFSGQPPASTAGRTTITKTLISQMGSFYEMGFANPSPLSYLSRPMFDLIGLAQLDSWPRSVYSTFFALPNLLTSPSSDETGCGLRSYFVVTLIVRIAKYHLVILEEDIFSAANRFNLSKNSLIKPSSLIERTLFWTPTSSLQNRLCLLTICLEAVCIKPVISKVKNLFSTSLCLYWTVTNHQSPKVFVELSLTRHPLACGKLLSSSCLRCLVLPSNYRIYSFYYSLVGMLVAIFDVPNYELDVSLNFVLGMI